MKYDLKWQINQINEQRRTCTKMGFEESSTAVIKEPEHTHSPPAQSVTVIGVVVRLDS